MSSHECNIHDEGTIPHDQQMLANSVFKKVDKLLDGKIYIHQMLGCTSDTRL